MLIKPVQTAIALLYLLTVAAAASAAPAPLGLDADGKEYGLVSNGGWQVSTNGGANFGPAKAVGLIKAAVPGAKSAIDRQNYAYIWAPTCVASKQTLTFRRTFYLPGPAKTFGAQFAADSFFAAPDNVAISSTKVAFNGQVAISINGAAKNIPTGANAYARLLRPGSNVITITVVKRPDGGPASSVGHCKYGSPPKPLGIYFVMSGEFEADLWLSNNTGTEEFYQRESRSTQIIYFMVSPRNFGPSGAYTGRLSVNVSASGVERFILDETRVKTNGPGLSDCKVVSIDTFSKRVECAVNRMPAHGDPTLTFIVIVEFPATYDTAWVLGVTDINTPTKDPNLQNDGWRRIRYLCSPSSTNPKCPPPASRLTH